MTVKDIYLNVYYINPNSFTGSDVSRIQQACDLASSSGKPVKIAHNDVSGNRTWILDEAVLLNSDTTVLIEDCKLKLSDSSRDNVFRSANCGEGIADSASNVLENIHIYLVGNSVIEGADNPRATGDVGKTLTTAINNTGVTSYGSDSGVVGETQTGDWRNIGVLFAWVDNVSFNGGEFKNMHAYAMTFENCSRVDVNDVGVYSTSTRVINGNNHQILNCDGVNIRNSGVDISIKNIYGDTGDDVVAVTLLPNNTNTGGLLGTMNVAGNYATSAEKISINNIKAKTEFASVRLLNLGATTISGVNVEDVINKNTSSNAFTIIIGSTSPSYGGATPIGNCSNVNIDNVISLGKNAAISIQGSLSESNISNIIFESTAGNEPIIIREDSNGCRGVNISNISNKINGQLITHGFIQGYRLYPNGQKANKEVTSTSYTIDESDNRYNLLFTNENPITLTVPKDLPPSSYSGYQMGFGDVSIVGVSGVDIYKNVNKLAKTDGYNSRFNIEYKSDNYYDLTGDLEQVPSIHPETTAYMTEAGIPNDSTIYYSSTPEEITGSEMWSAVNDFVIELKNFGILGIFPIYPCIGGTAISTSVSLTNPTQNKITWVNSPTFNQFGVTGNGTSAYGKTGFIMQGNMSDISNGLTTAIGNNISNLLSQEMGAMPALARASFLAVRQDTFNSRNNNEVINDTTNTTTNGVFTVVRQSLNVTKLFKNSLEVESGNSGGSLPETEIYVLNMNRLDVPHSGGYSSKQHRMFAIHRGLSDFEVKAFHRAIDNLYTAMKTKTW